MTEKKKRSIEKDYNHPGYYVLYMWHGFWDLSDEYHDDEWWNDELVDTTFFLNDNTPTSCTTPIKHFKEWINDDSDTEYHNHTAELWFVDKSLNKINAYKVAEYFSPYDQSDANVIKDVIDYDNKHPYYSWL